MPKYILILKRNSSKKPWIAHHWENDLNALKQTMTIKTSTVRNFESSFLDKKVATIKLIVEETREEAEGLIIQLYSYVGGGGGRGRKAAKKAARKK